MFKILKLKDICKVFDDGDWIEKKDQSTTGIRLIQTGNVKFGFFEDRIQKARYISSDTFQRLNCNEIFEGDILVSRLPDPIGRSCIIPKLNERAITAVDCTIIRLKEGYLKEYVNYFMQSQLYLNEIQNNVTGATRQRISRKKLGEIQIPLPSLSEQQHIIAKLDKAFAEIDKLIVFKKKLLTEKQILFEKSLEGIIDKNTSDVKNLQLKDVVTRLTNGYVGATKNIYQNTGIPYLLARHVKNNTLNFDGKTFISKEFNQKNKKSILKFDDVLMVQSGHIGHTAVVSKVNEGHNCHAMIVITTNKDIITGKYLSLLFNTQKYKKTLLDLKTGSTIPHLNCGNVKKIKIQIPSLSEQQKILNISNLLYESFEFILNSEKKSIEELKKLKIAILKQEMQYKTAA